MSDYTELVKELRESAANKRLMIYAADAIEELRQTVEHYKGCADDWYKEACEYKAVVPKWIPVTERLPEDMWGNVLVTDGKNVGMGWLDYYTRKDTGAVERDWFAPNTPVEENKITHWMPLPEPPKEETE